MAKFRKTQTSFTSGIIGPELRGRIDIGEYNNGALEIENFYGTEQGGLNSRHGLNYIPLYYSEDPGTIVTLETVISDCNKQVYFFDIDDIEWIGFVGLAENKTKYRISTDQNLSNAGAINIKTGEVSKVYKGTPPFDLVWDIIHSTDPDYYSWNVKADLADTKFLHTRVGSIFLVTHTSGKYCPTYFKWEAGTKRLYPIPIDGKTIVGNTFWNRARRDLGSILTSSQAFAQPYGVLNTNQEFKIKFIFEFGFTTTNDYQYIAELHDGANVKYDDLTGTIFDPSNIGRAIAVDILNPDPNPDVLHTHHLKFAGYYWDSTGTIRESAADFTANTIDLPDPFGGVLANDDPVVLYGELNENDPGIFAFGLKPNYKIYYVVNLTATTFQLSETLGGAPLDLTPNTQGEPNTNGIQFTRLDLTKVVLHDIGNYIEDVWSTGDSSSTIPVTRRIPDGTFAFEWRLSEWGGANGWPKISSAISSRFILANTPADPTTIWFSLRDNIFWWKKTRYALDYDAREGVPDYGQYTNEQNQVVATPRTGDAYSYILTDELSREIRWLYPSRNLEFGTDVGEFTLLNFTSGAVDVPEVNFQSSYGGVYQNPLKVGNATIFILKDGKTLGRILFDFQKQVNSVTNLNVLAPNIFNDFRTYYDQYEAPLIKKIEWDHVKRILWVVTTTGDVFSVSTSFNVDTFGWQKHTFRAPCEDILISSITVGKYTQDSPVFLFSNTLEHMVPRNEYPAQALSNNAIYSNQENIFNFHYLDSAETKEDFTGATSTWTFTNPVLENTEVHVFGDNQYLGKYTLDGFNLTLGPNNLRDGSPNYNTVTIGLTYKKRIKKTLLHSGSNTESGLEAYKRVDKLELKFHRSVYAKVGSEETNLREIPFPLSPNQVIDLQDYNYVDAFSGNSEPEHTVIIESELPLPVNILTITTRGVLAD